VFFRPLGVEELEKIVDIELEELRQRALETGYKLSVAKALKHAVAVDSYDPSYGARPLKRAIMNRIENPVSEFIISQRINGVQDKVLTLSVGLAPDGKSTKVKVK
jgi:ATP-dependent Clp protease ATP-binding subunit ClpA